MMGHVNMGLKKKKNFLYTPTLIPLPLQINFIFQFYPFYHLISPEQHFQTKILKEKEIWYVTIQSITSWRLLPENFFEKEFGKIIATAVAILENHFIHSFVSFFTHTYKPHGSPQFKPTLNRGKQTEQKTRGVAEHSNWFCCLPRDNL
jgi:hypothetical protein